MLKNTFQKIRYRIAEAYAFAIHCKCLYRGTPENEWVCMSVISDGTYGWKRNTYCSYPVYVKDGKWKIVEARLLELF